MRHQAHVTLVNGAETSALEITDRGLAYGDGLFETMRVIQNKIPLLDQHVARFNLGVEKLQLGGVKELEAEFKHNIKVALKAFSGDALLKVIITRGSGGRGYQALEFQNPTFVVQVFDLPVYDSEYYEEGIRVKLCNYQLPIHPLLAGVKHLNRLDQVLASQEIGSEDEGIVCDSEGYVVEGTKSNLLVFEADRVVTPKLDRCGVQGSLRAFLLGQTSELGFNIQEDRITKEQLFASQGAACVNSIFGCLPIEKIDERKFAIDERCEKIQRLLVEKMAY